MYRFFFEIGPVFCALALKNNQRLCSNDEIRPNFKLTETKLTTSCLKISPEKSHQLNRLSYHYPIHKI